MINDDVFYFEKEFSNLWCGLYLRVPMCVRKCVR